MRKITYELDGFDELAAYLSNAPQHITAEVDEELSDIAAEIEADIVLKITHGEKTGIIYKMGSVLHQSSREGESPASNTGTLKGSIYSEKLRKLTYAVGSRLAYAAHLEWGTENMGERPYFRPVVEAFAPKFVDRLKGAVVRGLDAT